MEASAIVKSEFDNICRLCLGQDRPLTSLFSNGPDEMPLNLIAQTCAAVDVAEEDGLPPNICCACRDTIISIYQFRQQVSRNDTILRCVADMKSDPDDEGLSEEAKVAVVVDEPSWPSPSRGKTAITPAVNSGVSERHSNYAGSDYIYTLKANPDETGEVLTNLSNEFLFGEGLILTATRNSALEGGAYFQPHHFNSHKEVVSTEEKKVLYEEESSRGTLKSVAPISRDVMQDPNVDVSESVGRSRVLKTKIRRNRKTNKNDTNSKGAELANKSIKEKRITQSIIRGKMDEYCSVRPDGSWYCKQCNKFYTTYCTVYDHIRHTHLQIRDFMCDQCGYRAFTKDKLIQHIDGIHLRIKKYKCANCPLRFCTKQNLNKHARKHRPGAVRTCMCEVCGKCYTTPSDLMRHLRSQHFPELKIKCQFCDSGFTKPYNLKLHIKRFH